MSPPPPASEFRASESFSGDPLTEVARRYAVRSTPFLDRLLTGLADDHPLVRQFRPDAAELVTTPDDLDDPIGDDDKSPLPGLVHRYPDRVLLKPVHVCAAYCRFCFRRAVVGPQGERLDDAALAAAVAYIAAHPAVWEVILTGGDPLVLAPRRLATLLEALGEVAHVAVVRVHTRLPVHDPARIDAALVAALRPPAGSSRPVPWVAVHVNHASELVPEVVAALARLADAGIPLVSQSVLLRGVNDSVAALEALFRALVRARVKPYYLHHPDPAPGTAHFRLPVAEGRALMAALRGRLSGLALPTYVLDRPGGRGKVPVGPRWPEDFPDHADLSREGAPTD